MKFSPQISAGLILAFAALGYLGVPAQGQEPVTVTVGNQRLPGVAEDWSHHRVFFSDPGTAEDALRNGKYDQWFRIVNDPRYVMQQMKRGLPVQGPSADDVARYYEAREKAREDWKRKHHSGDEGWGPGDDGGKKHSQAAIHKDWSMDIGPSAFVSPGQYPAKYGFSTTAAVNCSNAATPDFVIYPTSVTGSSSQASIVAYDNLYATTCASYGPVPTVFWAFNTGGAVVTSPILSYQGTQVAFIQTPASGNAQLVILKWANMPTGRNVTSGTTNITSGSKNFTATAGLTSMDVGAGISGTGIPAGDTIATITSATVGTLTNTATGNGTSGETLSITADAGGPDTLSSNGSYPNCTAPCMVTLSFSGSSRTDTTSSPYYDFGTDTLWVGDASGGLHKFHPVFAGTPAEVGSPWSSPSSVAISSPVYDSANTTVYVGDADGYVYSVDSSGTATKSVQVAQSPGIVDAPLLDITGGYLWVTVSKDTNATGGTNSACDTGDACAGVIELATNFTGSTEFSEDVLGAISPYTIWDGAFDNLYLSSGTGTGNIYVATTNGSSDPKLMAIPMTGYAFTAGNGCLGGYSKPTNMSAEECAYNILNGFSSSAGAPEPVTEIYSNSIDYIFTSEPGTGTTTGCALTTGCVYSWTVTTALTGTTAATAGSGELGGTSGIIVDNTLTGTTGAAQIYFSILTTTGTCATSGTFSTGGCAIQAAQTAP
jgi:hypothetical protein